MTASPSSAVSHQTTGYIACPECDVLHRDAPLRPGDTARCQRCDAVLYRRPGRELEHTVAFAVAAAIAFVIANLYPIMELEFQGFRSSATLTSAALRMQEQDMAVVGLVVLGTVVVAPAILLTLVLYLLLPLRFGRIVPGFRMLLRGMHRVSPWAMAEVMMLGVLVSLVKLGDVASVTPGIGLWAFGVTMLLMATIAGGAGDRALWTLYEQRLAEQRARQRAWA